MHRMLLGSVSSIIRSTLGFCVVFGFLACSAPNDGDVRKDFLEIAKRELPQGTEVAVTSTFPGEGDDENVYQHVRFDLLAIEDVTTPHGWLQSTLTKGEQRRGELVLLYQKNEQGDWVRTKYLLQGPLESVAAEQ